MMRIATGSRNVVCNIMQMPADESCSTKGVPDNMRKHVDKAQQMSIRARNTTTLCCPGKPDLHNTAHDHHMDAANYHEASAKRHLMDKTRIRQDAV